MEFPRPNNLETLDIVFQGQPYCDVPASNEVKLKPMDIAYQAQPFFSNYDYFIMQVQGYIM